MTSAVDPLARCPTEIIIKILSHLSYSSILAWESVSRSWRDFVAVNSSEIWKHVARHHHLIVDPCYSTDGSNRRVVSVEDAKEALSNPSWLEGVQSWKDYCKARITLEETWLGKRDVTFQFLRGPGRFPPVHRFQIDGEENLIITTSSFGGIRVLDASDTEQPLQLLFVIHPPYVRSYTHIEYSNGFLLFHQGNRTKTVEVWRRCADALAHPIASDDDDVLPNVRPSSLQQEAYELAMGDSPVNPVRDKNDLRGVFVPYASFQLPSMGRAYRMIYPTLIMASKDAQALFLYDVPSCTLIETIPLVNPLRPGEVEIFYVDLSERHCFVCTVGAVLVFARAPHSKTASGPVFVLPFIQDATFSEKIEAEIVAGHHSADPTRAELQFTTYPMSSDENVHTADPGVFLAAHVSEDGKDLVAITWTGRLYYLEGFERAFEYRKKAGDYVPLEKLTWLHRFPNNPDISYLAFKHGRIAHVHGEGVDLFTLKRASCNLLPESAEQTHPSLRNSPFATAHRFLGFNDQIALEDVTCLLFSFDSLWMTWSGPRLVQRDPREQNQPISGVVEIVRYNFSKNI